MFGRVIVDGCKMGSSTMFAAVACYRRAIGWAAKKGVRGSKAALAGGIRAQPVRLETMKLKLSR
jgi:hypothetical protein